MLTKVEVGGEHPLVIPLSTATLKDSLLIKKLDGLNPPDVTPFITSYARDGGYYSGRRTEIRNLVFTMGLNPNYALNETIPGLRELLYKTFLTPSETEDFTKFTFYDDEGPDVYTVGYTEKITTDLFDKDTALQISVLCPDPYLKANEETVLIDGRSIINKTFVYPGNAETGFRATLTVLEPTSIITFESNNRRMVIASPSVPFAVGDQVLIDTQFGSRGISFIPNGSTKPVSILGYLSSDSVWLNLRSEENSFRVYGALSTDLSAVVSHFSYTASYWGL